MLNVKFLNPFIDAAAEVLKVETELDLQRGNLSLEKTALTATDVTVLLTLVGKVQGVVMYGFSTKMSLELVSRMMGQKCTDFDNLAQSGIAELGNVITGRATIKLEEAGYKSMISPPTMITGKGIKISTLDFSRIVVPMVTDLGEIIIHLALRESPPGAQDKNFVPISVNS